MKNPKISAALRLAYKEGRRKSTFNHLTSWNRGMKMPLELRIKYGEKNFGANNPNWKGGVTPVSVQIRSTLKYRLWREEIYKRDNYTCVLCGIEGDINSPYLQADHIKSVKNYPELIHEVSNGRVLCLNCHSQTDNYRHRLRWGVSLS